MAKPLLGITLGDPNGIGPEIIAKACQVAPHDARLVVIGDAACLERACALVGARCTVRRVAAVAAVDDTPGHLHVLDLANVDPAWQVMGTVQAQAGRAAYEALIAAADLALAGQLDAIVTAPLNKEALHLAGVPEPGHTEVLAARAGARRVTMMLVAGAFRVTHVSTHCALREAIARVKTARVLEVIELTHQTLLQLGITQPRLAVAGLNPHAGEGGLFGDEELNEIQPAIEAALARGIGVAPRPQPPDTVFYQMHARGRYDAVVAMYHDQGHIPTKLLGFDEGVNVTLGLPLIRTSVDHGTAYDIAGQGSANPSSLLQAIQLATALARGKVAGQRKAPPGRALAALAHLGTLTAWLVIVLCAWFAPLSPRLTYPQALDALSAPARMTSKRTHKESTMTIRAGVVGAGILGSQHAAFLAAQPEVQLVGVADLRLDVAERIAAPLGAAAFTSLAEMATQCLDLVVIATPDPLHLAPCLDAIEAGVPCIIEEKPLATTIEDGKRLVEAIERHGTRFFVNYANRAATLDIATGYVLQQGLLGDMVYGEARLDDNISVPTQMWGGRSRDWAAGSSTAHFLLSHVVDLLHWYLAPARVTEVYAIAQQKVLGATPDLYDAFLTFDTGVKIRVKAEWIKHIDELVEFYMCFSGSEGTLIYNKRGGFGTAAGWRANLSPSVTAHDLLRHRDNLAARGVQAGALIHRPSPATATLAAGGASDVMSLEYQGLGYGDTMALCRSFVDAILEDTLTPTSWKGHGPVPTHVDGWRQTQVVCAIIQSAATGRAVTVEA